MTIQGFIKLHRQILDWEWYSDANTMRLFIHCLIKANYKDKQWHGILIKEGSFITSYEKLSIELGLTIRQIRTAIDKLKMTNEITYQSTNQYSIISINNWNKFQEDNRQIDNQMTIKRQTNDKQMTTTNKDNNNKEISILCFLNQVANRQFKTSNKMYIAKINKWLKEYSQDEIQNMISYKAKEWLNDKQMCKYLRPDTLFSSKLPTYIEESKTYGGSSIITSDIEFVKQIEQERRKKYGW